MVQIPPGAERMVQIPSGAERMVQIPPGAERMVQIPPGAERMVQVVPILKTAKRTLRDPLGARLWGPRGGLRMRG
jgi:hypothetical protein